MSAPVFTLAAGVCMSAPVDFSSKVSGPPLSVQSFIKC